MQIERSIMINAAPVTIFSIYEEVDRWNTWDPETRSAILDGPFAVGSRGHLVPTKGRGVPMIVTKVRPQQCFTVESRIPFFRMVFDHEIEMVDGGSLVTHRVTFSGALTALIGRMLCRRLHASLPVTLNRLKALAESRSGTMAAPGVMQA
jgi:hypothetical protein